LLLWTKSCWISRYSPCLLTVRSSLIVINFISL
jgi:hypothetical protein